MMRKKWACIILTGMTAAALLTGCTGGRGVKDGGGEVQTAYIGADDAQTDEPQTGDAEDKTKPDDGGNEKTKPVGEETKDKKPGEKDTDVPAGKIGRAAYITDRVYAENGGNTLFSPLSLDMALGMACSGAKGTTKEQMDGFLGTTDYAGYAKEYLKLANAYNTPEQETKDEEKQSFLQENMWGRSDYRLANSIWVDETYSLLPAYRDLMEQSFGAEIDSVDFSGKPAETAGRINDWCAEKTEQMIPQIVSPALFTGDTKSVLVNTVYFSSAWVELWNKPRKTEPFVNDKGEEETTQYLYQTASRYFENDKARAFAYPYRSGLYFVGILPKKEGDFSLLELDIEDLLSQEKSDLYSEIYVKMPGLNYESGCGNLKNILTELGMTECFSAQDADFSGMAELPAGNRLFISDVIQKCKIELDENGTKAAAATALMMCENAAIMEEKKTTEVYLDRPYAFLIWDEAGGEIPFMGKVVSAAE